MSNDNEYMRQYMAQRRARRRAELADLLGGRCARCGVTDGLDFDHVEPGSQTFRISGRGLDKPWPVLLTEVAKCQLLCRPCHRLKTKECGETGGGSNKNLAPVEHGTPRCYQELACRCPECRLAKSMYRNKEIGYCDPIMVV